MWQNSQETTDLVTFTGEILNGKIHFLWSDKSKAEMKNRITYHRKKVFTKIQQLWTADK